MLTLLLLCQTRYVVHESQAIGLQASHSIAPLHNFHPTSKTSCHLPTWPHCNYIASDSNDLLSSSPSTEQPLPYLNPSRQSHNSHLHHFPSSISSHFRHAFRLPRPQNHIPPHSDALRAVELGPCGGTE